MEISVIVPILNAEKTLRRTLDALRTQTADSFEVIMVDNGSTDASVAICMEYAKAEENFRCIKTEQAGVSNARNLGMEKAAGRFLCFCDADDVADPNMLRILYEDIQKHNADYVLANYFSERDNRNSEFPEQWQSKLSEQEISRLLIPAMFTSEAGKDAIWGTVWRGIFRKDMIDANGLRFDTELTFAEDLVFVLEYLSYVRTVYLEKAVLYQYSMTEGSAMLSYNRYKPKMFSERVHLIASLRKPLERTGVYQENIDTIHTVFQEYMLECVGNVCLAVSENGWLDTYRALSAITKSSTVKEVFQRITTRNRKHRVVFQFIKARMNVVILTYYFIRRKRETS